MYVWWKVPCTGSWVIGHGRLTWVMVPAVQFLDQAYCLFVISTGYKYCDF